ncbi:hypothetical protein C8F04DRAFT_1229996 [Mycena alexandri]|uniref:F-box domain-containing protein n=1 Tax=Mycena alexandri TaxID=1745969 RepID=A0AAD6XEI5_9AGAR|nr:hypothetical protein C8F04DRAFT_1229996 [Mycena alexandri]
MHRCLKIPEILQMIFTKLSEHNLPSSAFRPHGAEALSRLAQTCQEFSDPALNILWKYQYTLTYTSAQDLSSTSMGNVGPRSFLEDLRSLSLKKHLPRFLIFLLQRFRTTINPVDFDRVLKYSSKIRDITIGQELQLEVMEILSLSLPVDQFLPNLLNLGWTPNDGRIFPYISLFLGQQLTCLYLRIGSSLAHSSLLSVLASKTPCLTNITLRWNMVDDPTLATLQTLSVPHLDLPTYRCLASRPNLTGLSLENLLSFDDVAFGSNPFPGLTRLLISSPTIASAATAFVGALSNTPLKYFECASEALTSVVKIRQLCSALAAGCSLSHLMDINMALGFDEDPASLILAGTITADVLAPLLVFPNLRRVTVDSSLDLALDDAFCAALAAAWPRIEQPTVSLLALVAFARHCPRLAELTMEFNAQGLPDTPYPPLEPRISQRALRELHIGHSPIDSPFLVARFLSIAFPALEEVIPSLPPGEVPGTVVTEPNFSGWREVGRLLPMLVAIRMEDEMYWKAQITREAARRVFEYFGGLALRGRGVYYKVIQVGTGHHRIDDGEDVSDSPPAVSPHANSALNAAKSVQISEEQIDAARRAAVAVGQASASAAVGAGKVAADLQQMYDSIDPDVKRKAAFIEGGVAVGVVAPPLIINALGFTQGGVAAGSAAAGIHAGIGNVAAGSAFAALQSAGVVGLAPGAVAAAAGLGGVAGHFLEDYTKKMKSL